MTVRAALHTVEYGPAPEHHVDDLERLSWLLAEYDDDPTCIFKG